MNRLLSIILSIVSELFSYFRPAEKKGAISLLFIIASNSVPAAGVIFLGWNPYMLLIIYWGESLIIGIFNLLKMLISGAIQKSRFSPSGFAQAIGLSLFFTFHYGMFMFVHGVFIIVFMMLSSYMGSADSSGGLDPFSFAYTLLPKDVTITGLFESEISATGALLINHMVSFYIYFIKPGEFHYTTADDYMMRPYKRIIIMHLTIIFGAFALFISGFKSAVFIIIWIGLKILSDLRIQSNEIKNSALKKLHVMN